MSTEYIDIVNKNNLDTRGLSNPFPGLRPFGIDESHLFFGREGQSDDVLEKLANNRFVTVVGASGSGKSSLMYCGVIPLIQGGFVPGTSSRWSVITSRPGAAPIENLANALLESRKDWNAFSEEEQFVKKTISSTVLRSSSLGLIDSVRQLRKGSESFLIVIDQFEELFRFNKTEDSEDSANESVAFLNLLLEATEQSEVPIFVALTMRSDFIGDCAQYPRLTNRINQSHYLIPQMTREQRRRAIEGPVAVGGGVISPALVQRVLNDVGDNVDQLPLMQHALMRTWQYSQDQESADGTLSLANYETVGTITEALSQHANEAFAELTVEEQRICEILFKSITEKKEGDRFGVRRPTSLSVIASIAEVDNEQVIAVIERFRDPQRSLLTPSYGVELRSDSVIDISHESLMRIWDRLGLWVEEEGEAAQMYLRLSGAAEKYQVGRAGLWRPPDLQLALNWQDKYEPSLHWAQRYDPAFERAMVFLRTSKDEYESEQTGKEEQQKRRLRTARIVALLMSGILIIALIVLVFAIMQRTEALKQEDKAEAKAKEATEQRKLAEINEKRAIENAQKARDSEIKAIKSAFVADSLRVIAVDAGIELKKALDNVLVQKQRADLQTIEAKAQRNEAEKQTKNAVAQKQKADKASADANQLRFQALAQSMAVKSLQLNDTDIKGLNALQAYEFHQKHGGPVYDNYIFEGLYYADKKLSGENKNLFLGHKNSINDIEYDKESGYVYTASSDGRLNRWKSDEPTAKPETMVFNSGIENRAIAISPNRKWLALGSSASYLQLFDLTKNTPTNIKIEEHAGTVWDIKFMPDNSGFYYSGADSTIWFYNFIESKPLIKSNVRFNAIDVSPDGKLIAAGTNDGKLRIYNTSDGKEVADLPQGVSTSINVVKFNHKGDKLVSTHLVSATDAELIVWRTSDWSNVTTLRGREARMDKIEFSENDKLMLSASHDGTARLWLMGKINQLPTVFNDHDGWVMSADFAKNDDYIITGTSYGQMRLWPTRPEMLVDNFCSKLSRNMTEKEWNQFVADDIPYIATCSDK